MEFLRKMRISQRIALLVGGLFGLAAIVLIFLLNQGMKRHALEEARTQSRIILDRNLAIHGYFSSHLKPPLFVELEDKIAQGYFDPNWMSSTFAVREINKHSKILEEFNYYYKECAINARSPENEADTYEQQFIRRLNADPLLTELAAIRLIDGKPYLDVLRRGETMEQSCLRCHSTPDVAPVGLVERYGATRSFGRRQGEVVSAMSIRVPLDSAYIEADHLSLQLSFGLLLGLAALYLLLLWLQRTQVFAPLGRIAGLAEQIAGDPERLGEQLPSNGGRELNEFIATFNEMSRGLRHGLDRLHDQTRLLQRVNRELQRSEEQYRALVTGIHAAVVVHNADTSIQASNPLAQELLGLGEEQLLGRTAIDPVWKFLREDGSVMPPAEYPINLVLAGGQPLRDYLLGICRPDREEPLWVLVNADPVLENDGSIARVIICFVDLTERRRTERRLALLDHALNQVQEAAYLVDEQARFHYVNAEACRRLGYSREELLQLSVPDIDSDLTATEWPPHWNKVQSSGSLNFESYHRTRSGEKFPVEINSSFLEFDGQGYLLALVHDISERKQSEQQLRRQETFIRNILDTVDEGFIVVDRDYKIQAANQTYCDFVGRSEEEVLGQRCFLISHTLSKPCFEQDEDCAVRHCFATGLPQAATHQHKDITGAVRTVELKAYPVFDGEERPVSVIETIADVTERRRLEEQLRQSLKLEAVGRLAGGVAHDFNNMLAIIIGRTELALRRVEPDTKQHNHLCEIEKAAQRSAGLTRQLLAFARKQAVVPQVLDLNRSVEGMLNMLQRLIGEEIELTWLPGADLWPMQIDPSQLDQILANLCVNARDSIDGHGHIRVATRNLSVVEENKASYFNIDPGEYVVLEVGDDGCGMEPELLEQIFEPFFTSKEQGRGTGLGLATIYGIVKQNHGFVYADSTPGTGTTFSLFFPRHSGIPEQGQESAAAKVERGHEILMLVEDESAILDMTRLALEELGYKVLATTMPTEALQLNEVKDCTIDLLVTDVVMPGMNGRELAQQMQARCPRLRCLFISGYTNDAIAHHGVLEEGVNFLQKPFTMEALAIKIREILDA